MLRCSRTTTTIRPSGRPPQPVGDLLVVAAGEGLAGEAAPADDRHQTLRLGLGEERLEVAARGLGVELERVRPDQAANRRGVLVDPAVARGLVEKEPAAQPFGAGLVVADVDQDRRHAGREL
jgi:hypothetical protein